MAKRKKKKRPARKDPKKEGGLFPLPKQVKKTIISTSLFLASVVLLFSFLDLSGLAGRYLKNIFIILVGRSVFIIPVVFFIAGLIFIKTKYKRFLLPLIIASILVVLGLSGIFEILTSESSYFPSPNGTNEGGWLGNIIGSPLLSLFDFWISFAIFACSMIAGSLIFAQLLQLPPSLREEFNAHRESLPLKIFKKVIGKKNKFTIKNVDDSKTSQQQPLPVKEVAKEDPKKPVEGDKAKPKTPEKEHFSYKLPPPELLQKDRGVPNSGDTTISKAMIKKTLENFDIPVEMGEAYTGPTVTQYTLKPAEGIKLSKITTLSNDLSLVLAAHSVRIEAPIPGKSLVGVEIPNKVRSEVRLRGIVDDPRFFDPETRLTIGMGKDVSGESTYAHLEKMPHLLIAGATGAGKTIFLNTVILSLLFKNSPKTLRLILVDPKRVEFTHYEEIPHLLTPVIHDVHKTCNALKWLTGEMERRLKAMSVVKARDIKSYNVIVAKNNESKKGEEMDPMPYIVLIVDELADLMSTKGRDVEAGIVRLAQMARAAGIHLVLATQRPSVEVITGLIKANVTSRVAFQVASQIDSRTIIDTSGAEKLIGAGDFLYVTGDVAKPRRLQGPYVSEKEIKGVVEWMKVNYKDIFDEEDDLGGGLELELEVSSQESFSPFSSSSEDGNDVLYDEAKKLVLENKKASASFLQRRLRIGYARAARLIDMMEERGVVGSGDGAKAREVYGQDEDNDEEWHKI